MSDKIPTDEVHFQQGYRHEAIRKAIELVKETGRSAELVICRDIPGDHSGGEDCFCDPKIMELNPEDI